MTNPPSKFTAPIRHALISTFQFSRAKLGRAFWPTIVGLSIVALGLGIYAWRRHYATQPFIAYIGRYSRPSFERINEEAIRHFVELDAFGRHAVALRCYKIDVKGSSETIYHELVDNPMCIGVIDNSWGSDLRKARDVIAVGSLPVISINADKAENDYNDRVAFIGHDDLVPQHVTQYLRHQHVADHIVFVGEDSYWSTPHFRRLLKEPPLSLRDSHLLSVPDESVSNAAWDHLFVALLDEAKGRKDGSRLVLALNVHRDWGEKLILKIDELSQANESPFSNCLLIGGTYIFSSIERGKFKGQGGCQLVLLTSPNDALSPRVLQSLESLRSKHGNELLVEGNSGYYVTRCNHAVEMLRFMISTRTKESLDSTQFSRDARASILTHFQKLKRKEQGAFVLSDTVLLFDEDLLVQRTPRLELYDRHGVSSHKAQLTSQGSVVPNVYIGLEITAVRHVDLSQGTFVAEFSFSIRYDKEFAADIEQSKTSISDKWDPGKFVQFPNSVGNPSFTRIDSDAKDDSTYYYRCIGTFSALFDASDYPFDAQALPLRISLQLPSEVALSFDEHSFSGDGISATAKTIPGWVSPSQVKVGVEESLVFTEPGSEAARAVQLLAVLRLNRDLTGPTLTVVFPLVGMGLCACLLLFLQDLSIGNIGEISVGLFIGFIGYVISFRQFVPDTAAISRADWILFVTAVVILVQLLFVIAGNVFFRDSKMKEAQGIRLVRVFAFVVLTSFCLTTGYIMFS